MTIMGDGFATLISLPSHAAIKFAEKTVTPPGVRGGGANDTTTMRNSVWRTKQPKKLKELSDASANVAWDPAVYDEVVAAIQVNQLVTITFPDNSTLAFWGWLDEFVPGAITEGSQPTADITIVCGNQDNAGAEVAPVYTAPP